MKESAMKSNKASVLAINGGSSSIKFVLYQTGGPLERRLYGKIDRIGLSDARLSFTDVLANQSDERMIDAPNHVACVPLLVELLEKKTGVSAVSAIGHRVVHGGPRYRDPVRIDGRNGTGRSRARFMCSRVRDHRRRNRCDPGRDVTDAMIGFHRAVRTQYQHIGYSRCASSSNEKRRSGGAHATNRTYFAQRFASTLLPADSLRTTGR